jgi:hypothetical protein
LKGQKKIAHPKVVKKHFVNAPIVDKILDTTKVDKAQKETPCRKLLCSKEF